MEELNYTKYELFKLLILTIKGIDAEINIIDLMLTFHEYKLYGDNILDNRIFLFEKRLEYIKMKDKYKEDLVLAGFDCTEHQQMTEKEWLDHFSVKRYEELIQLRKEIRKPMPIWRVIKDMLVNRY
jgi:hypothetical protein